VENEDDFDNHKSNEYYDSNSDRKISVYSLVSRMEKRSKEPALRTSKSSICALRYTIVANITQRSHAHIDTK